MFDLSQLISQLKLKNQELLAEKELMRDRVSSRTSESNGDKSDSESDTQERGDSHPTHRGDKDRLKELQETISTLNTQMNNFNEPLSTPSEDINFIPPTTTVPKTVDGGCPSSKLTNGHIQLESAPNGTDH